MILSFLSAMLIILGNGLVFGSSSVINDGLMVVANSRARNALMQCADK